MKIFFLIFMLISFMDAKMHFYTLKTKSNFLLEFPTKKVKNIELSANYSLGVNNALHHFDFQGYIFKNKEGIISGYDQDILTLINKHTGANFQLTAGKWKEMLISAQNREIDGLSTSAVHKQREKDFSFSQNYISIKRLLVVANNNPKNIHSVNDLMGKRIAYQEKNLFEKKLVSQYKNSTLVPLQSIEEIVQKLILGEIDATVGNYALIYTANKLKLPFLKIIDYIPNSTLNLVFSIRKDYPEAISILNKGLNAISENDKTILRNKWFFKNQATLDLTAEEKKYLQNNPVITVQNLSTLPPFNFNENGIPKGYTIEYMKLMAEYMGVNIKFISGKPWNKYLTMLKENSLDIIPHIAITDKRKEFIAFTNFKHIEYITGIAINKEHNINSINDLKDKIIAVTNKTFIHTYLKNKFPKQKLFLTKNTEKALEAVSLGKAFAVIGSLPALNYYIQKNWHNNIKISKINDLGSIARTQLPMGINKENKILKSILEKTNNAIPYNEVLILKQKWMNIKTIDINHNTLTNEEVIYIDKKKELKICVDPNWLPFEQIDKDGIHKGIGADIMKLVSKYINTPTILVSTKNWGESLQNIIDRKCDVLPVAMNIPSRRDSMNFTRPYIKEPFVIATKLDQLFIKDGRDIGNRKIGIIENYAFIDVLKQKYPDINIVTVKDTKDGLERVQSGKLFGYVDIMPTISYAIQKYSMLDLKIAGKLEFETKLSIATRSDEPILNSILQKVLDNISEEQIRTITGKWISIKVEKTIDYTKFLYVIAFFSIILILVLYKNRLIKQANRKLSIANKVINVQKKKAETLNQYQKSLLSLFDKGDSVLYKWINDENRTVDYVSESITKLTGYKKDDFLSKRISYTSCIHKDDLGNMLQETNEGLENKLDYLRHEPYRIITKEAEEKWILDYKVTQKDAKGNITYCLGYITDITEHVKQQEIIFQQSKMASLGEMLGNISHQWRQPLSVISTAASGTMFFKDENILTDDTLSKNMNHITTSVQYLSKTIDNFIDFIKEDRELMNFNLTENIHSFLSVVQPAISTHHIRVIENYQENIFVKSYPNDMIQSFINIFNNAKDVLMNLSEDERYFFITTEIIKDKIVITLKDNGGGMDNNILNKVFEPYTTTKHKSQGIGLGMNMTYNLVVTGMQGEIYANNIDFIHNGKYYKGVEIKIKFKV